MRYFTACFVIIMAIGTNSYSLAQDINISSFRVSCDSTIQEQLKNEIDVLIANPIGVSQSVIDSSQWVIIGDKKVYSRISTVSFKKINIKLGKLDKEDPFCAYMNYANAFDYLLTVGLDLNFDYYSPLIFDKKTGIYTNNFKSEEYRIKKPILDAYFLVNDHYKEQKYNNDFLEKNNILLYNIVMLSDIKNPNLVYNILMNEAPLDKEIFLDKRNRRN